METVKTGRRPGKILWRVLLGVLALICAAVLELGKHTILGWVLAAVVFAGFCAVRAHVLKTAGKGLRVLAWCALLALLACVLWVSWPPEKAAPAVDLSGGETGIVHVSQGDLTGVYTADRKVEVYAGIPYAEPPVGDLRWKEPVPAGSWEGVLKADHFAPMSMQTQNLPIYDSLASIVGYHDYEISLDDNWRAMTSEDSLYLNIWKPAGDVSKLPVLVYVHGGSLQTGHPWFADYSGEGLARENVVVVNMGYRLGVFGFFADEALAAESPNGTTGNYGLLDQILALKWVQENIAAFGGDPGNVTLAGESAGSACVTALCTSPLAKGLFRRAVGESSTVTAPRPAHSFRSMEAALRAGKETKARLNADSLEELRALPAEKIVDELSAHHHMTVDGYVLTETPWETYEHGSGNAEAIMHGFNREEAAPFTLFSSASLKNYEQKIRAAFPAPYADRVLELYPASTDAEAKANWNDIDSVILFVYGHICWERQAQADGLPSYMYHFVKDNGRLGAWHSGEEIYLYGNIPDDSRLFDAGDRELSRIMKQYYVNFIRTGDPNGEGLPEWPSGTGLTQVMEFGDEVRLQETPWRELVDILDAMYAGSGKT